MQKKKALLVIVPLLSLIMLALLWRGEDRAADGTVLSLYGNVEIREAQLAFNASEHIKAVLVEEGDSVSQGQLLAHLHTEVLDAQLAEAQAALVVQQQLLRKLEAGSRPEEIHKGEAELTAAHARAKSAQDSYQRIAQLLDKKLASRDDVENARALAEAAQAQVDVAVQGLALLKLGPRTEDIAAARAQLVLHEAVLSAARQRLVDTRLYAPANGVIRNRILEPGEMAFPQVPVLTLALSDPVWVRAYLPEPMLGRVKPGLKATIHSDSYPGKRYEGWVGYISPTAEFTPKTVQTPELRTRLVYSVRVFACNSQGELRLGMPVTVTLTLDQTVPANHTNRCDS
ncbi:MAG: HlyD family efflux transporter periplasmic adaptor subunit [Gammaproteobacteria bacterium]|nr:HlyD family efflux transporter periplasmic adaptor subunit [Gammaproteobacteria bacterium]